MVEAKDHWQADTEAKLPFHPGLTLVKRMFTSLKVCSLKVRGQGTDCEAENHCRTQNKEGSLSDLYFKRATLTAALKMDPEG